jgi:hypothetical protein
MIFPFTVLSEGVELDDAVTFLFVAKAPKKSKTAHPECAQEGPKGPLSRGRPVSFKETMSQRRWKSYCDDGSDNIRYTSETDGGDQQSRC